MAEIVKQLLLLPYVAFLKERVLSRVTYVFGDRRALTTLTKRVARNDTLIERTFERPGARGLKSSLLGFRVIKTA